LCGNTIGGDGPSPWIFNDIPSGGKEIGSCWWTAQNVSNIEGVAYIIASMDSKPTFGANANTFARLGKLNINIGGMSVGADTILSAFNAIGSNMEKEQTRISFSYGGETQSVRRLSPHSGDS